MNPAKSNKPGLRLFAAIATWAASSLAAPPASADQSLVEQFDRVFCGTPACDPAVETRALRKMIADRKLAHWSIERRIRALANVLEATGDEKYLRSGKEVVSLLYGLDATGRRDPKHTFRDDLRSPPVVDAFRRQTMIGWSSNQYGVPYVSLVQTAAVMSASARFANEVLANPKFNAHHSWAREVLDDSGSALTRFTRAGEQLTINDGRFLKKMYALPTSLQTADCGRAEPNAVRACEVEKAFAGRELPFNQTLAIGLLAMELFEYKPNESQANLLVGMTNHFFKDSNLKQRNNGDGMIWLYWSAPETQPLPSGYARTVRRRFDDLSHGNIIVGYLMKFAKLQDKIVSLSDRSGNPLFRRVDDAFIRSLEKSVLFRRDAGGLTVDRSMGQVQKAANSSTDNVRYLQEWCLVSPRLAEVCAEATSQVKDPIVTSYAVLASKKHRR